MVEVTSYEDIIELTLSLLKSYEIDENRNYKITN